MGVLVVRALRIPSVVSRVRRYGEVKKWRVSSGRRRERSLAPAWAALDEVLLVVENLMNERVYGMKVKITWFQPS